MPRSNRATLPSCGERHHVSICPQRQAVKPFSEARNIAEELPNTDVQSDIARHSTDAEVLATSDVATPACTVRTLLKELGATQANPTAVFSDSNHIVLGLMLIDDITGEPVAIDDIGAKTTLNMDATGNVSRVRLRLDAALSGRQVRAYLITETYPAASATLALP